MSPTNLRSIRLCEYTSPASSPIPAAARQSLPHHVRRRRTPLAQIPSMLVTQHDLDTCIYNRNGVPEVHFLAREEPRLLPVQLDGDLRILAWGNRRGDSATLPLTLWTSLATVEAGGWSDAKIAEAVIPATLGFDRSIWFAVTTGVRGLVVADERGERSDFPS